VYISVVDLLLLELMKFLSVMILLMSDSSLLTNSIKCYTCEKICGPDDSTWNVTECQGSCRKEFMKLPGNNNNFNKNMRLLQYYYYYYYYYYY